MRCSRNRRRINPSPRKPRSCGRCSAIWPANSNGESRTMQVAELQSFIRSLTGPLACAGAAKKVGDDLERIAAALEPFKSLALPALADFLAKAEEYHRTGILPASATPKRGAPRARTPKPPPITIPEPPPPAMPLSER